MENTRTVGWYSLVELKGVGSVRSNQHVASTSSDAGKTSWGKIGWSRAEGNTRTRFYGGFLAVKCVAMIFGRRTSEELYWEAFVYRDLSLDVSCSCLCSFGSFPSFHCPVSSWVVIINWCRLHHSCLVVFFRVYFLSSLDIYHARLFVLVAFLLPSTFFSLLVLLLFDHVLLRVPGWQLILLCYHLVRPTDRKRERLLSKLGSSLPHFLFLGLEEHTCVFYIRSFRAW